MTGVFMFTALSRTSDLLGLNPEQLAEVLTHRSMILRGEEICTPLTVEQVTSQRGSRPPGQYCLNPSRWLGLVV